MIRRCWSWSSSRCASCRSYNFPGDDIPVDPGFGAVRAGRARGCGRPGLDPEADGGGRQLHPAAGAGEGPSVPDADRGRVHDLGPRHGGDGADRARDRQGRRRGRDRGAAADGEDDRDGCRDVPQAARPGRGGGQCRGAAARDQARGGRARPGAGEAGFDHAAHEFPGGGLCPDQGGGRASHAVLRQLPAAVLFPDDGRDRVR